MGVDLNLFFGGGGGQFYQGGTRQACLVPPWFYFTTFSLHVKAERNCIFDNSVGLLI